jgi:ferredoxin--NADP+ reductase
VAQQWKIGRIAHKTQWNDTHYSLAIEADGPEFVAGQFIRVGLDLDEERVGRPYSLVNPPHAEHLEIFFNIVPEGPLSSRLAAMESGDEIWLTDSAAGLLTLDEVPTETRDLWLLATGTGVGPFLSMLQTDEPWSRFDHIVLGYGVRNPDAFGYEGLIEQLQQQWGERFKFVPYVTGEPVEGAFNCRIPITIEDGRLEESTGLTLSAERSHVMLCGHSGMITDAVDLLQARGLKRHRRREPGQISTEKYH